MIRKSYIAISLLCMLTCLAGCGEKKIETAAPELLEPVSAEITTEAAAYRNLYNAQVYSTVVLPYIEEYAFTVNGEVERFEALPGESVSKGERLVFCNTEDIDERIDALTEKLTEMKDEYLEYGQDVEEDLFELRGEVGRLAEILEDLKATAPSEYIVGADGTQTPNPEYEKWSKEYLTFEGKYLKQSHKITMQEASLRQRTELYELDSAYYRDKQKALEKERNTYVLTAGMDGEIVAIGQTGYETYKAKSDEAVIAVGDTSRKILKCSYIQKTVITKAEDVYAMVDGVRYELEYQPMDVREYMRLTERGETVYTTFEIKDPQDTIPMGADAVVVIVKDRQENVLTVPEEAIHKEAAVRYVYVVEDGQSVRRNVKVGMSDGVYTEILSGLSEGEPVKVKEAMTSGEEQAVLEKGTVSTVFLQVGYLYYPSVTEVINPVQYGTAYHVETNAALYQYVEKGDLIATVKVEADEVTLQRNQLKLQRLQERLQDLIEEGDPVGNAEKIADKQEEIEELSLLLQEMHRDAQITQITAPVSGIIIQREMYGAEEKLKSDAVFVTIADINNCYVKVKNAYSQLQYGKDVQITYKNAEEKEITVSGTVTSVSPIGVSEELQEEESFVLVPPEYCKDMIIIHEDQNGKWDNSRYRVYADVKMMNGVVLVPNSAVTEVSGCTYVHVPDEKGGSKAVSFISGGHDNTYYWVIEGLTEGMKVCLE